jgi:hypothetical protein
MESMLGGKGRLGTARFVVLAAVVLALVALPAPAGAAYSPHLAIAVAPTSATSHVALTTTLTQASGDDANRSVRFHFPVGFTLDGAALGAMPACGDPSNCPPDTSLGTAAADTPLGAFTGSVFLGTNQRIFVVLKGALPGVLDQRLTGTTLIRPDGGIDVDFDQLPSFPTTRLQVALDGPPRSFLVAPVSCGDYEFSASFVSQNGAKAAQASLVTISANCGSVPAFAMSGARVSPRSWRRGRSTALRFTLSSAAQVEVTVRRLGSRRVLQRRRRSAGAGLTRLTGLARGLRPARYVLTVRAVATDGRVAVRSFVVRVRRR